MPICMKWVDLFIRSEDWKYRYAALMSLTTILETCAPLPCHSPTDDSADNREASSTWGRTSGYITHLIISRVQDPHPRVRHAAFTCLFYLPSNLKRVCPFRFRFCFRFRFSLL